MKKRIYTKSQFTDLLYISADHIYIYKYYPMKQNIFEIYKLYEMK
jgi:hypothetical protein